MKNRWFVKKILLTTMLFGALTANFCFAAELNEIFYGVRGTVDALSDVNRLRGQVMQTNAQKQQIEQVQNNATNQTQGQDTSFSAKTSFANGNLYLKQGKYREAIDSYAEAKKLFASVGDSANAQKAEQAMQQAIEMRCEFGDYCQ